jgi:hypothetical protein
MEVYLFTDGERVTGCGNTPSPGEPGVIKLDLPEDHEVLDNPFVFVYVNGELMKDEEYQQQKIAEKEAERNQPSEIEQLQVQNAALAFEVMTTTAALQDSQQQQADLIYDLMTKGVV